MLACDLGAVVHMISFRFIRQLIAPLVYLIGLTGVTAAQTGSGLQLTGLIEVPIVELSPRACWPSKPM